MTEHQLLHRVISQESKMDRHLLLEKRLYEEILKLPSAGNCLENINRKITLFYMKQDIDKKELSDRISRNEIVVTEELNEKLFTEKMNSFNEIISLYKKKYDILTILISQTTNSYDKVRYEIMLWKVEAQLDTKTIFYEMYKKNKQII